MDPTVERLDRSTPDAPPDSLALHVYPAADDAPALAVLFPAMGVPARYYRTFAAALTAAGLAVVVADLRGTGESTPAPTRSARYGLADLVDDVDAVLTHLKPLRAGRRTILIGHSLGGQACVLHLSRRREDVDGLVLLAVGVPYWRRYPSGQPARVLLQTQTLGVVSALLRVWPGWGFGGRQARGVIRDWAFTARTGRYPEPFEAALGTIAAPVFAVDMAGDRFTPPGTVTHLLEKLPAADVTRTTYAPPDQAIDHFRWAKHGTALARDISAWTGRLP